MLGFEGLSLETVKARSLSRAKRGWGLAGTSWRRRAGSSGLRVLISKNLVWPSATAWSFHAPPPLAPLPEWPKSLWGCSSHTALQPSAQGMQTAQGDPEPCWEIPPHSGRLQKAP